METQAKVKQCNSQEELYEFFKGLEPNYQRIIIQKMRKKPPDSKLVEFDAVRQSDTDGKDE